MAAEILSKIESESSKLALKLKEFSSECERISLQISEADNSLKLYLKFD